MVRGCPCLAARGNGSSATRGSGIYQGSHAATKGVTPSDLRDACVCFNHATSPSIDLHGSHRIRVVNAVTSASFSGRSNIIVTLRSF
jgi:hypothetical protein